MNKLNNSKEIIEEVYHLKSYWYVKEEKKKDKNKNKKIEKFKK